MRVLCSTTGNDGHFGPLLPFARALVATGHEVRVAAPASYAASVARAGLPHEPFGEPAPEVIGPIMGRLPTMTMEDANRTVVREVFARSMRRPRCRPSSSSRPSSSPDLSYLVTLCY